MVEGSTATVNGSNILTASSTSSALTSFGTSPTISTLLTVSGAALGGTATNETIVETLATTTTNGDYLRTKWRRISTGADWSTAQAKIQRTVDVTDMGYIGFGGTSTYDVRIGSATTDIATFAPTAITLSQATTVSGTISATGLAGSLLTATTGAALGTASAGTATVPARADHVHPTTGLVALASANTFTNTNIFNTTATQYTSYAATVAPTVDMVRIINTGFPNITAGVSALQVNYIGGAAAVEASAARVDITPGTTTGGTWNGFRVIPTATATTGVTYNALKFDTVTLGTGTNNVLYAGTGYTNIISYNGTSIINGSGQLNLASVTGTLAVGNGGTGSTTSTGTAASANVLQTSPTITTPVIDSISASAATGINPSLYSNTTTGTIGIGAGLAAGTITLGGTAVGSSGTFNIMTGATTSGTKAINIGTNGSTGSTTTINIGTTAGTTPTIALNGVVSTASGSFKVGNTTLAQGVTGTVTFPATAGTLITSSSPTITTPQLQLETTARTTDGSIYWDSTYDVLSVGNGTTASAFFPFTVNATAKTAAYLLTTADANTLVQMNGAFAFQVASSLSALPIGTQIHLLALTAGVTVATTATAVVPTIYYTPGLKLRTQYSTATLIKLSASAVSGSASTWLLTGDLSA